MPRFHYRAVTAAGETIDGQMEATDKAGVISQLQQSGHVPIRAEEQRDTLIARAATVRHNAKSGLTRAQLVLFTRQMATLLKAGLPLDRALQIAEGTSAQEADRQVVRLLLSRIEGGKSLADAMASVGTVFPPFYIGMIRAGEAGASLDSVMERLADFIERAEESRQTVRSALQYPLIVGIASLLCIGLLFCFVIPQFKPMFDEAGAALPLMTAVVIAISDAMRDYWWAGLLALLGIVLLGIRLTRSPAARARWDREILRLPVFGDLVRKIETARFSRTLGTLLRNGVPILASLEITRQAVGNRFLADALPGAIERVKQGRDLGEPLAQTGIFPTLAIHLVRVGDETGKPDDMLLKIAEIYDQETERTISRMLGLVGPAITVILGVIIAVVIGSIMMAILSVYELAV